MPGLMPELSDFIATAPSSAPHTTTTPLISFRQRSFAALSSSNVSSAASGAARGALEELGGPAGAEELGERGAVDRHHVVRRARRRVRVGVEVQLDGAVALRKRVALPRVVQRRVDVGAGDEDGEAGGQVHRLQALGRQVAHDWNLAVPRRRRRGGVVAAPPAAGGARLVRRRVVVLTLEHRALLPPPLGDLPARLLVARAAAALDRDDLKCVDAAVDL